MKKVKLSLKLKKEGYTIHERIRRINCRLVDLAAPNASRPQWARRDFDQAVQGIEYALNELLVETASKEPKTMHDYTSTVAIRDLSSGKFGVTMTMAEEWRGKGEPQFQVEAKNLQEAFYAVEHWYSRLAMSHRNHKDKNKKCRFCPTCRTKTSISNHPPNPPLTECRERGAHWHFTLP